MKSNHISEDAFSLSLLSTFPGNKLFHNFIATAKYNSFIPFFTVDGRSYCCEIDENCGEATQLIRSMEHCLTFAHEITTKTEAIQEDPGAYWKTGSSVRRKYAEHLKLKLVNLTKGVLANEGEIKMIKSFLG